MLEQQYRPREPVSEPRSPLPLVGWALVIGSLISYGYLLIPLKLMDADWEFSTMGPLVDNSLLCLMGMGLVFYDRPQVLGLQKLVALRGLLVLGVLLGFIYLLMVPLALSNERRLEVKQDSQFASARALYADRVEKIQGALKNVKTIQDLKTLGSMLNFVPSTGERRALRLDEDFDRLRQWMELKIRTGLNNQKAEAQQEHERNLARLQKDGIHIIAGATLAAVCYWLLCSMNFVLFREHVAEPGNPRREN
jgi:hypothetical protein